MIGGFVVIFSCIISILNASGIISYLHILFTPAFNMLHIDTNFINALLTGFLEITNGINQISHIATKKISINIKNVLLTFYMMRNGTLGLKIKK